jgi:hypothetical protein
MPGTGDIAHRQEPAAPRPDAATEPAPGGDELVSRLDRLVDPAPEPENAVLTDDARIVRWAGPMFALFAAALLPWIVYIGLTLPARQLSPNFDIAWSGFDVMLFVALASTGYYALRRSRYLSTAAGVTSALLIVDAWFDVMTTPGAQRAESILLCAVVELPLAAVCLWLSHHTHQIAERRILLLQRRRGFRAARPRGRAAGR